MKVEVSIMNGPDFMDDVSKLINKDANLCPHLVSIKDPVAWYVEFGTGPAFDARGYKEGNKSPVYDRILNWATSQKIGKTGKEAQRFAWAVYKRLMNEGMPPQPFFRPAIHAFEAELKANPEHFEGMTVKELADELANRIGEKMREHNTPYLYKLDSPGRSIVVEPVRNVNDVDMPSKDRLPKEIWDSDVADYKNRDRTNDFHWNHP